MIAAVGSHHCVDTNSTIEGLRLSFHVLNPARLDALLPGTQSMQDHILNISEVVRANRNLWAILNREKKIMLGSNVNDGE